MKTKVETDVTEKMKNSKKLSTFRQSFNPKEKVDETYLEINQFSFQQNFNALIGHYKNNFATAN